MLGRDYMAQPGSPSMRRRCHPTLSLRPTQAKSGINAQEEARGSRARELAIGSMRATIARPKRLARQACKQQLGLSSLGCWQLRHSAGGVGSPPSVGGGMRASCAESVLLSFEAIGSIPMYRSMLEVVQLKLKPLEAFSLNPKHLEGSRLACSQLR